MSETKGDGWDFGRDLYEEKVRNYLLWFLVATNKKAKAVPDRPADVFIEQRKRQNELAATAMGLALTEIELDKVWSKVQRTFREEGSFPEEKVEDIFKEARRQYGVQYPI
jgi:hypothetical protein